MPVITKPSADEFAPFYATYVALTGADALSLLEQQAAMLPAALAAVPESLGSHRYGAGKWSVKEVLGHLADGERIFSYRALRFGRADDTELPGFEENHYVPAGRFDARPLADLVAELASVRDSTLWLYRGLDDAALLRRGTANGHPISVRALAHVTAGHMAHHLAILRERYGLKI